MRRLLLILACFAVSAAGFSRLVWRETEWDFGAIKEVDGKATHGFVAVNAGVDTVSVESVRSSCGCTTSDFVPSRLLPGDSLTLSVTYNPSFRPGPFDKPLTVSTSGGNYRLSVKGRVVPTSHTLGKLFPKKVGGMRITNSAVVIGEVKQGGRRTANVMAYNASDDTLRLRADGLSEEFDFSVMPDTLPPGHLASVSVTCHPARGARVELRRLPLRLFAGEEKLAELEVTARVVPENGVRADFSGSPRIVAAADRLDFTPLSRGKKRKMELEVRNEGKSDLLISDAVAADSAVTVEKYPKKLKPGGTGKITVAVDGDKLPDGGVLNSSIAVYTNDPLNMTLQIRVVGASTK